jgi:uncharacterized membrane protein (UPF0182 family)
MASVVHVTTEIFYPAWTASDWQLLLIFYAICLVVFMICFFADHLLPATMREAIPKFTESDIVQFPMSQIQPVTNETSFLLASLIVATVSIFYPAWTASDWQLLLIFYAICLVVTNETSFLLPLVFKSRNDQW